MTEVRAEVAGRVSQVHVEVGQEVSRGDSLATVEAMKMEIPVEAPTAGVVTEVRVSPTDRVQEGDVVAVIGMNRFS